VVERIRMPECYQSAQIYVQPSRFEGMSNAILEAMASGLPIIATDVDGNPDLVNEGENGLLVPTDDPPRLAAAMQQLLTDPELREKMGRASRRIIEESFTFEQLFNNYEKQYRKINLNQI